MTSVHWPARRSWSAAPAGSGRRSCGLWPTRFAGGVHLPPQPGRAAELVELLAPMSLPGAGVERRGSRFCDLSTHWPSGPAGAHRASTPRARTCRCGTSAWSAADDFGQQVNTDVGGFFNLVSAVLPHLRRSGQPGGGDDRGDAALRGPRRTLGAPEGRHRGADPRHRGRGRQIRCAGQLRGPRHARRRKRRTADRRRRSRRRSIAGCPEQHTAGPVRLRRRCRRGGLLPWPRRGPASSRARSST